MKPTLTLLTVLLLVAPAGVAAKTDRPVSAPTANTARRTCCNQRARSFWIAFMSWSVFRGAGASSSQTRRSCPVSERQSALALFTGRAWVIRL